MIASPLFCRLDCYMALTLPYAIKVCASNKHTSNSFNTCILLLLCAQLAKALQPYNLKWIEECLPPDDYHGTVYTL